jgi:DNA polymerase
MVGIEADFETRSDVDLRSRGAYCYFESPRARVLLGSFRIAGQMHRWRYGQPCPPAVRAAIEAGETISAHNAAFEYLCFAWLADNCDWPRPRDDQFRCTAATAAAMALPRALGDLAEVLDLPVQKDKEGRRLIQKFSVPQKDGRFIEPEDDPADFDRFCAYCDVDVLTEAGADARMVPLSDAEQQVYLLSERINRRGVRIDHQSAQAALRLADKAKAALDREMSIVTGAELDGDGRILKHGDVPNTTTPARLVAWVEKQGVPIGSAAKAEITDLLHADDLPQRVRRALEIRQEAAKSSVAKLKAMLDRMSADGRVRGTSIYHGASTGRWTDVGVNKANLPRPRRCFDEAKPRLDVLFRALRTGEPEMLHWLYGEELGRPLHLVADAIRGFIWAAPGHDLVQADYSGIEGAVIAWLADEQWKLAEMHAIIADPSRPDMYRQTAAAIMNTTTDVVTKKHPLRQSVGKTSELALGFQGGVSAFFTMARNYNVDLNQLYEPVWAAASAERRERAAKRQRNAAKRKTSAADVLSPRAWIACEIIKQGWREANPAIAAMWQAMEQAVRSAVASPGTVTEAGRCKFRVALGFLWMLLPSGRALAFAKPKLKDQVWAEILLDDGSWSDPEVMDRDEAERLELGKRVRIQGNTSPKVTFAGVGKNGKTLVRQPLYGGLIAQNATQATARDLLVNGMQKAEAAGYPVIMHVYDEMITEVPRGFGSLAEFERLICELPEWATGVPLTAGGWRGKRYRKD